MSEQDRDRIDPIVLNVETIHSLNNHLAVIFAYVELMLQDTQHPDQRRQDLLEIKQAAAAITGLLGLKSPSK